MSADRDAATCDGSIYCEAYPHIHGCFADKGDCDHPSEHASAADVPEGFVMGARGLQRETYETEDRPAASGALTRADLDRMFEAIDKAGSTPRHDCRFDGHVLQWNPRGFAWCIFCHASEAEIERPS